MHSGTFRSFRSRFWRRVVAPVVAATMCAGLCPLPASADAGVRLTVAIPRATGEPALDNAVLASVDQAVRQAVADSPSFTATDAEALAKETVSAQEISGVAEEALRLAAARLGAELVLQLHVARTQTGKDGVVDIVAAYRLVDVIAGEVVTQGETVGVSGATEPAAGTKLDQAARGLARQVCQQLERASGLSVGLGAADEHGLVAVSSVTPGSLPVHSWLMVFRGERHVAALEVVQVDAVSAKARVRYLKGISALGASDRVGFVFTGGLASTPPPREATKLEKTPPAPSPPAPGPTRHRRHRTWQKLLGILALVGIVALVSNNGGGSSSPSSGGGAGAGVGNWQIDSSPSGASVTLDGQLTGRTTPTTIEGLSAGSHTITLTLSGYNALTLTKTIVGGQTLVTPASEATLTPGGTPPSGPPAPQP